MIGSERIALLLPEVDPRVRAAADGQRSAVASLLREHLPRIRNLVRYLVHGDQDVDDFAQEAMLAVIMGIASYRGDGPIAAWIDRVVAHTTITELRKRKVARRMDPVGPALELVPHPDSVSHADEYLASRRAVQLLDRLPAEQRHALVLHFVLGMSVPEIAEELARPPETVRSRLRIGMERLRALAGGDR